MKKTTRTVRQAIAIMAFLIVGMPTVQASNGVSIIEFSFNTDPNAPNMYVACIGDRIAMELDVRAKNQVFTTPSGAQHRVSNWNIEGIATGLDSGWSWFVSGTSPLTRNVHDQQVSFTLGVNLILTPLDGGPRLKAKELIRLIANANGELKIADLQSEWSCLGS